MTYFSPDSEAGRLAALQHYGILDTPPEASFEHITSLATRLFDVPIATVTLIDANRQWFKSVRGLKIREGPREHSFCAHAMTGEGVMVINDATLDACFAQNPLVTGKPHIRFYAGAPLCTPEGQFLGALALIDRQPRTFDQVEQQALQELAALAEDELLLRRVARQLRGKHNGRHRFDAARAGEAAADRSRGPEHTLVMDPSDQRSGEVGISDDISTTPRIVENGADALAVYDLEGRFVDVNDAVLKLFGYEREELLSRTLADVELGFDLARAKERWQAMAPGETVTIEGLSRKRDGKVFWTEVRMSVLEADAGRRMLALVRDISGRKQAEERLRIRARNHEALAKLGSRALGGGSIDELLQEAVNVVRATLNVEVCCVHEHLAERKCFVVRASQGLDGSGVGSVLSGDDPSTYAGYILATGEPVIVADARTEKRFQLPPAFENHKFISALGLLIGGSRPGDRHFGILGIGSPFPRTFTEDDVHFVQLVANILAAAIIRRRTEESLREVEIGYNRIAAHTPGMVYQHLSRPDGTVAVPFISENCRKFYGVGPSEIQARPAYLLERIHPEDRQALADALFEAERTLIPLHWRGRHLLPSGEVCWVQIDSRPEKLPDGGVMCDGIVMDVTEEKNREVALRQSEERFRLANFHSPCPTLLFADDGEVLQVNDAWTHITGYTAQELTTFEDWMRLAFPTRTEEDPVHALVARLIEHVGAVRNPGVRIRCAGGEERIWDFSTAILGRLPDGRWLIISTASDMTERHALETVLRQAKDEAERANHAKSVFLSRMSHELRTPLNAILGFGQLLETGPLAKEDLQSVNHILSGGKHLLSLVDDVLDLARVESGQLELQPASVSLRALVRQCIGLVERVAKVRDVTCRIDGRHFSRTPVLADEQRLRQVLLNLLSNAIKYNRPNGSVLVSCERMISGGMRLTVKDTGLGISPEQIVRLFVPFERLGQEYGEAEGTGLGLVVTKQLIEAMNGRMGVESEPGVGSSFWIELPVAGKRATATGTKQSCPAEAAVTDPGSLSDATLLYIEDNPSNVQVVKMVVERLRPRWTFLSATDGSSGLAQARKRHPDCILLDLQLPDLNGDAVLAELRADPSTNHLPVLLLSADAMSHSRERLLALGANDYLAKPFNVNELLTKLDLLLVANRVPAADCDRSFEALIGPGSVEGP